MTATNDQKRITVSVVVPKPLDAAIRADHARQLAVHIARHGSARNAPSLSSVWVRYVTAGLAAADDTRFADTRDMEVA